MGIKILLADDSTTAQNMGKKILSEAGHDVVTVSNGAAAAKKIAEINPDLVLLDVFMPGYTGLELCEKLRNAANTSKLPVLLTVGRMEPYNAQDGARVRADGVIVKPFEASDLTAAVDRLAVKAKPSKAQSAPSPATVTPFQKAESFSATTILGSLPASNNGDRLSSSIPVQMGNETEPSDRATQEFTISAIAEAAQAEQHSATPAFHEELDPVPPAAATPQLGDHIASYLESTPESSPEPVGSHFGTSDLPTPESKSFPAVPTQEASEQPTAFGELETFEPAPVEEAQLAAPEGFETTAPVHLNHVTQEPGFEATLQSSPAAPDVVAPDPAFISDLHRSTNDFPTSFGVSESHPALELPTAGSNSEAPLDEFEARLQAAMSSFEEPAQDPLMARLEAEMGESRKSSEAAPLAEPEPVASSTFEQQMESGAAEPREEEIVPEAAQERKSEPSWLSALPAAYHRGAVESSEEPEEKTPQPASLQEDTMLTPFIENSQPAQVDAISGAHASPAPAPDTDELVIQQMRESLARLRDDVVPAIEAHTPPMAMAAAAAATPHFDLPRAEEPTQAIEAAEPPAEAAPETEEKSNQEHGIAGIVERVMQRELPGLIGKIMDELKLHKHS